MVKKTTLLFIGIALVSTSVLALPKGVTEKTLVYGDLERTYFLFVPEHADSSVPLPVVLLLHGSNRDGMSLLSKWRKLAKKEGIILVGPDSADPSRWSSRTDGPSFLKAVIEDASQSAPVDMSRVYIFGHSGGACWGLILALKESTYFAAVAVHAGRLERSDEKLFKRAKRKTPVSIQIGTQDPLFPLELVRRTAEDFKNYGHLIELKEIWGHDHWYYTRAKEFNKTAWKFLKQHALESEDLEEF